MLRARSESFLLAASKVYRCILLLAMRLCTDFVAGRRGGGHVNVPAHKVTICVCLLLPLCSAPSWSRVPSLN
jgi:hypothetical protein